MNKKDQLYSWAILSLKFLALALGVGVILLINYVFQEWKIFSVLGSLIDYILMILSTLIPIFIAFVIAWLLDPLVTLLKKKGINRVIGALFSVSLIIFCVTIFLSVLLPHLYDQLIELTKSLPLLLSKLDNNLTGFLKDISGKFNLDYEILHAQTYSYVNGLFHRVTSNGTAFVISGVQNIILGSLSLLLTIMTSFYMLIDFDSVKNYISKLLPHHTIVGDIVRVVAKTIRQYLKSALLVVICLCLCQTIAFTLAKLPSPLAFGLFCAVTNIIPYIGPIIGGVPAVLVGFSVSPTVGISTLIGVLVCQLLEGYLITPNIMSKTMKLHPVTIIIGLSIMGSLFGIIGMALATLSLAVLKTVYLVLKPYINIKYFARKREQDESFYNIR